MRDYNLKDFLIVAIILAVFLSTLYVLDKQNEELQQNIDTLKREIRDAREKQIELQLRIEELKNTRESLDQKMQNWLDEWEIQTMEVTFYAPLDPQAKEGVCYQGSPDITASGEQVVIGETIAAGTELEFGTKVWIEGIGWREVQDRGGAIGSNNIDVAVATKGEALRKGRVQKLVISQKGGGY